MLPEGSDNVRVCSSSGDDTSENKTVADDEETAWRCRSSNLSAGEVGLEFPVKKLSK